MRKTRAQTVMRAWQDYRRSVVNMHPKLECAIRLAFLGGAAWHMGLMQDHLNVAKQDVLTGAKNET